MSARAAVHRVLPGLAMGISLGAPACSSDVFDATVNLQPQTYQMDFGAATGTIPTLTCAPAAPGTCNVQSRDAVTATTGSGNIAVDFGCDAATDRCFAEATARITAMVDVLQDSGFVTAVERRSAWVVKSVSLAYTVPTNTLTFDVPKIDVYVGPPGTTTENDPGVAFVDSTMPLPAGTTLVDPPGQLTVAPGSAARDLIVSSVEAKRTLVFVVVAQPRIEAGAPVPAGMLVLDVQPSLGLGL